MFLNVTININQIDIWVIIYDQHMKRHLIEIVGSSLLLFVSYTSFIILLLFLRGVRLKNRNLKFGGKSLTQTVDYLKQLPIQIMLGFQLYISSLSH